MTRADREIALAVALAWTVASEAADAAAPGSAEQSALRDEEGALDYALDAVCERLDLDASDLVQQAERLQKALTARATDWEQDEAEAAEQRALKGAF